MSLGIFDTAGRQVRAISEEAPTPGTAAVQGDGCDSRGRRAAPGTYFWRLKTADTRDALKLVVLR
jgi:hypothetical protein